ncbi:hypothetical protein GCM10010103_31460 [Streptomyces paradoxus]
MGGDVVCKRVGDASAASLGDRPTAGVREVSEEHGDRARGKGRKFADRMRRHPREERTGYFGAEAVGRQRSAMGKHAGAQERWDGKASREFSLPRQDEVNELLGVVDQRLHETTPALTVRTEMGAGRFQILVGKAGQSVFQGVGVADGWIQHVHPPGCQVELTKKGGHNGHRVNGGTDVMFYLAIEE